MRKLLTASLLLAGCALQPAMAQKTSTPQRKAVAAKPDHSSPAWVPNWVSAEFCEAYSRYFLDLPYLYKYNASQALRNTPLADPEANLTSILTRDVALREAVYKTIYQYCYTVKYGYGSSRGIDELVYLMLYRDFRLSNLAATQLAMHIDSRYKQPAPSPQPTVSPIDEEVADRPNQEQTNAPSIPYQPRGEIIATTKATLAPTNTSGLELAGWRFDSAPVVEAVDDEIGIIRFKIKISDDGEVEAVTKVSGNVSPAQEKLCREKLLDAQLIKTSATARTTTGFYTFRFSVR
jgi:hypothetical protein